MKHLILCAGFAIAAIGCVAPSPTQTEIQAADYGPSPTPSEIESAVKGMMGSFLKDADSARYEFSVIDPKRYWVKNTGIATDQKMRVGWATTFRINAKNGFGGYTGFKIHQFIFSNGRIIGHNPDLAGWTFF